ncbi:hypothetical protein MRX96_032414 [Rhipicephalus microplus]
MEDLFPILSGDDPQVTELESLCLQCRKNGITRLLLTKIPFYREVVVMSFHCEHCGWQNSELQPAASVQPTGIRFELLVRVKEDLNRQVVKTRDAVVTLPEIELEIPARTQEGCITTVEGVLQRVVRGLENTDYPESRDKLTEFVSALKKLQELEKPFRLVLDDPSGNSFVENPQAPGADPSMKVRRYERTAEQDLSLGILSESNDDGLRDDVLGFTTNCSECQAPCETRMKVTQGDSATGSGRLRMGAVVEKLTQAAAGKLPVTLVLDDPCGNSYVQNLCAPEPDPALKVTQYERTFEQNELLGLNDMRTENYL